MPFPFQHCLQTKTSHKLSLLGFCVFCPKASISPNETHNLLRGFVGSLNINAEKRRTLRKKSNSINLCSARFANKYFIWRKKYKAVIPITKIMNAK